MPPTPAPGLPSTARILRDRRSRPRPTPGDILSREADLPWRQAVRRHWPEYAIEAFYLAVFILVSGFVVAGLERLPGAPDATGRRLLAGLASGAMVTAMIYSAWGRRSGSHLNPAITLAYLRVGKVGVADAVGYVVAQLAGALVAVLLLRAALDALPPAVVPLPGLPSPTTPAGIAVAALVELVLAGATMLLILFTSNHSHWYRWTGALYGVVVGALLVVVPPLSDFGLNPARLLAVDVTARAGDGRWVDLLPPLVGMLLAVDVYRLLTRRPQVLCAKLAHNAHGRCIFRCQHPQQARALAIQAIRRRGRRDRGLGRSR